MHGGNVYEAARQTGRPLRELVDFSASINPLGPSPFVWRAVREAAHRAVHYPDPECVALRDALAEHLHLTAGNLVVGNGSTELIYLLPAVLRIRHAAILGPTFSEYARAITAAGGRVTVLNARRAERYRPPVERALALMRGPRRSRPDALFICNPNSPTGRTIPDEELSELMAVAARQDNRLIVDETFVEYCEERSILPAIQQGAGLLVLRSFTKFYALPGFRVGYLAGPSKVVERIREQQPPWSVNTMAQCAALAALKDRRHARKSLTFMSRERPYLANALSSVPGVTVYPSEANFLLVELPAPLPAAAAAEALRRQGVLVRDCSSVPGLTETTIRVAVRTRVQNRRLVAGLRAVVKETR